MPGLFWAYVLTPTLRLAAGGITVQFYLWVFAFEDEAKVTLRENRHLVAILLGLFYIVHGMAHFLLAEDVRRLEEMERSTRPKGKRDE